MFCYFLFSVKITTSVYPVPSICQFDQLGDWFESVADILHWNLRKVQLNLETDRKVQGDEQRQPQDDDNIFNRNENSSTDSIPESPTEAAYS